MLNDPVLMNDWHVVAYAPGLKANEPMAVRLLEEDLVLWRVGDKIHAWRDLCVHRGTRLSLGKIQGETLMCAYHGWTYNEAGQCIRFPAHPTQTPPAAACVKTYQAREKYNWIWVCLADTPRHKCARVLPSSRELAARHCWQSSSGSLSRSVFTGQACRFPCAPRYRLEGTKALLAECCAPHCDPGPAPRHNQDKCECVHSRSSSPACHTLNNPDWCNALARQSPECHAAHHNT